MTRKSATLVSVQLICIAVLVVTGRVIPQQLGPFVMMCAGVALIVWAVVKIRFYNLRIEPEPSKEAKLITSGPFRFIRHPMYSGGTLIGLAWVWDELSLLRLFVFVILFIDFLVKLHYEERLLTERFPEYLDYKKRTKRLVPLVY